MGNYASHNKHKHTQGEKSTLCVCVLCSPGRLAACGSFVAFSHALTLINCKAKHLNVCLSVGQYVPMCACVCVFVNCI